VDTFRTFADHRNGIQLGPSGQAAHGAARPARRAEGGRRRPCGDAAGA
jgi:hypothetical protein